MLVFLFLLQPLSCSEAIFNDYIHIYIYICDIIIIMNIKDWTL